MSKSAVAGLLLALWVVLLIGCSSGNDQTVFDWVLERAVWNDAGTRLAFTALGGNGLAYIYSVDDGGGNRVLLTQSDDDDDLTDEGGKQPAWSPDGANIAIVASRGTGSQSLYLIDSSGGSNTSEVPVTNPATVGADVQPNWISNTSLIFATTKGTPGGRWDIYSINSNGTGLAAVIAIAGDKQWPDQRGTVVVYQKLVSDPLNDTAIALWDTAAPGETIVANASNTNGFRDEHPSFNPAGTRIVFTSDRNGTFDIWAMDANAAGTNLTQLTSGQSSDGYPVFSRDGTRIVFLRDQEVWTMNADGTNQEQVTQVFQQ
jgi:TolB protein